MLVDIFNSFEPIRFLIDSPLWVSFFAPGVGFMLILGIIYGSLSLILRDKKMRDDIAFCFGVVLAVGWLLWALASLTEVFIRAGVAEGYPLVLAVIVGAISNILTLLLILHGVFTLGSFVTTHSGHPKSIEGSGEDM